MLRFITLIDELYDAGVRFFWTSERDPQHIFQELIETGVGGGSERNVLKHAQSYEHKIHHKLSQIKIPQSSVDINVTTKRFEGRLEQIDILEGQLASVQELTFAFRRAASRMVEMSGCRYQNRYQQEC